MIGADNIYLMCCFFFKQKTAYEMRISDWSSDVCSSDLEAQTTYGKLGVKVWICKGEVFGKRDLSPNIAGNTGGGRSSRDMDHRDRRPGGGGGRGGRRKKQ